jgi:hypothetical protein
MTPDESEKRGCELALLCGLRRMSTIGIENRRLPTHFLRIFGYGTIGTTRSFSRRFQSCTKFSMGVWVASDASGTINRLWESNPRVPQVLNLVEIRDYLHI